MLRIRTNKVTAPEFILPYRMEGIATEAAMPSLLIVDDDEQVLRVAVRLLRGAWRIETASNAFDAIRILREKRYDALLTDYEMPGENGLWLLEQARRYQPAIRRVLFSGNGPSDLSDHLHSGLVHCFVAKPPERQTLSDSLKRQGFCIRN